MRSNEIILFIKRAGFLLLPFFVIVTIELALPENFFSPGIWGSIVVYNRSGRILLPGPFYPNEDIRMNETGDLGMHTSYAKIRDIHWVTNSDGYHTKLDSHKTYDVVLIGDSMAIGSGMNQEDTPAEALSKVIKKDVYGMGGIFAPDFIHEKNIEKFKPKVLVIIQTERTLTNSEMFSVNISPTIVSRARDITQNFIHITGLEILNPVFVLVDRFMKQNMFHDLRAKVTYAIEDKKVIKYDSSPMLFLQGDIANVEVADRKIEETASKIAKLSKYLNERGVLLVFVPVPNKETVYWDVLPGNTKPNFIPRLTKRLQEKGVVSTDTQELFLRTRNKDAKDLYHTDDTHWNEEGVRIMMKEIALLIKIK